MNAGPLEETLKGWGKTAIDNIRRIATQSAKHIKSKIKMGIENLSTKIFAKYGIGVADEEYRKSVLFVTESIYNDLFGNIDMTLFANDCESSHSDDQYNTHASALNAITECKETCVENVANHYKIQIDYLFKMQQLSVHPNLLPNELIIPTDFDRMIFIIDLMCSPDPISYELGIKRKEFVKGYKTAKCGDQTQHVATVSYDRRGNPMKPTYSAVKSVGTPFGRIQTIEDVIKYSPSVSDKTKRDTKLYFRRKSFQTPAETLRQIAEDESRMPSYVKSQLLPYVRKSIKSIRKANRLSAKAKKSKSLYAYGFKSKKEGKTQKKH